MRRFVPENVVFDHRRDLCALDLDSIDAVDLVVRLQQEIQKKVEPEDFRQIRTLGDVVAAVSKLMNA